MDLAKRPDDKKLILSAMSDVYHPDMLKMIEPYPVDAALKAEAEAATKKIREGMSGPPKVTASVNNEKAGNAIDGKPDTRWDLGGAQSGGEWFQIEFPTEREVSKIILDSTASPGDYPRGYEVYLSRDGKNSGRARHQGRRQDGRHHDPDQAHLRPLRENRPDRQGRWPLLVNPRIEGGSEVARTNDRLGDHAMRREEPVDSVNPVVLRWARVTCGLSTEDVARHLKITQGTVENWESGAKFATLGRTQELALLYRRPLASFFLPGPPEDPPPPTDFRVLPRGRQAALSKETLLAIREARRVQAIAVELAGQLGQGGHWAVKAGTSTADPEARATKEREGFGVEVPEQLEWKTPYAALRAWRSVAAGAWRSGPSAPHEHTGCSWLFAPSYHRSRHRRESA